MATSLTWETVPFIKHIYAAQWSCHNIKRKSISPFRELNGWLFIKLESPLNKNTLHQVWSKLVQWFWRRWFFKFHNCIFFLFHYYFPLGKKIGPSFDKTWILFTQDCAIEISPVVLEKIFLNFVNVFSLFRSYLPLEKGEALNLSKLESHLPKDVLYQVRLKLAHWFLSNFFFNFVNVHVFSLFRYHLSGKAWCPSSEQTLIPITQECFVPSLFEIAPVVLGENILKFVNDLPLFRYYLPLEKERGLHLNKIDFSLPKDALCQIWLK